MDITTIELRKLTAAEGMVLTNGETYGKEIYLGKGDNPENWHEIPESEVPADQIYGGDNNHEVMSETEETETE